MGLLYFSLWWTSVQHLSEMQLMITLKSEVYSMWWVCWVEVQCVACLNVSVLCGEQGWVWCMHQLSVQCWVECTDSMHHVFDVLGLFLKNGLGTIFKFNWKLSYKPWKNGHNIIFKMVTSHKFSGHHHFMGLIFCY